MPTAASYIENKQILPTSLDTQGYTTALSAQVMERSFVMACTENAKHLSKNKEMAQAILKGRLSPAEAREQLRRHYAETNYQPKAGEEGTIKDLRTVRRMKATLDTNVRMAQGWARRESLRGKISRPGLELYRAGNATEPRDWWSRWQEAGNSVGWQGASSTAMIALHESPIWLALSAFGHEYPPFDWGSHMNIKPVSLTRCIELGLIGDEQPEEAPAEEATPQDFNKDLAVSVESIAPEQRAELSTMLDGIASVQGGQLSIAPPPASGFDPAALSPVIASLLARKKKSKDEEEGEDRNA